MWWSDPWWLLSLIIIWPLLYLGNVTFGLLKKNSEPANAIVSKKSLPYDAQIGIKRLTILRTAAVMAAILALAGTSLVLPSKNRQISILIDASESIGAAQIAQARKAALGLIQQLKETDSVAISVFAGETRVITPLTTPEEAQAILETDMLNAPHPEQSNLKAAIRVGKELLNKSYGIRSILLFSDGHPTIGGELGDNPGQITKGSVEIPIETVPIGLQQGGLITEELELPELVHPHEPIMIIWKVSTDMEQIVTATVKLNGQITNRKQLKVIAGKSTVPLQVFSTPAKSNLLVPGVHRLEVEFSDDSGHVFSQASRGALLQVRGPAKILIVHGDLPFSPLRQALEVQQILVKETNVMGLPEEISGLAGYSAVILDNVPALYLTESQQTVLQGYVAGGGGLLVIGGDASLGRGEYYATGLEDLLPVQTDTRQRLFFNQVNLLFVIDHSGSMSEMVGKTSKQLAAMQGIMASIEDLSPQDEVGILSFDTHPTWVVPFTSAGRRSTIKRQLLNMEEGGGTDMSSAFKEIVQKFRAPGPVRRHVVILTDGLTPDQTNYKMLCQRLHNLGVTITTIGIGNEVNEGLLKNIAQWGNGQFYRANLDQIPKVLNKETVRITRDLIQEGNFQPVVKTAAPFLTGLERNLPVVSGYLITKPKNMATVYLQVGKKDPLLAGWRYGNGQVAVFTSDSGRRWLGPWSGTPAYNRLWSQTIRTIERSSIDNGFRIRTRAQASTAQIVVEAIGYHRNLRPGLQLLGRSSNGILFNFQETAYGHYEACLPLNGAGLQQFEVRERPGGNWALGWVWNPLNEELQIIGPDYSMLGRISSNTGGKMITLTDALRHPMSMVPPVNLNWALVSLQNWLIIIALLLLVIELGYRSTSLGQMSVAKALLANWWATKVKLIDIARKMNHPELNTTSEYRSYQELTNEAYRYLAERSRRKKEGSEDVQN